MTDAVRVAYDARAKDYAAANLGELERIAFDRERLETFAQRVPSAGGVVADVGCGPGHVVHHLAERGVEAVGYDLSPGMIAEARRTFPRSEFRLGDLTSLAVPDASFAGLVARYSLIHLEPERHGEAFREWSRVLQPGAPALVSFFASDSAATHGQPFDHAVLTAYAIAPRTAAAAMRAAGFEDIEVSTRPPLEGERPLDHATILARRARA